MNVMRETTPELALPHRCGSGKNVMCSHQHTQMGCHIIKYISDYSGLRKRMNTYVNDTVCEIFVLAGDKSLIARTCVSVGLRSHVWRPCSAEGVCCETCPVEATGITVESLKHIFFSKWLPSQ